MAKKIKKLDIVTNKSVFTPTGTSSLLIEASKKEIKSKGKILDLGCGSGIIGISLYKRNSTKKKIFFSDISLKACQNVKQNCKKLNVNHEVRHGSILKPWKNFKFDYIISDVAAIADEIAKISPWYKNCINNAGIDGSKNAVAFINSANKHLNKKGKIIFPIISLSNEKKIFSSLKKNFKKFKKIKSQVWPLPKMMYKKVKILEKLKKKRIIFYDNKFGILTFKTDIYCAIKNNG